MATTTAQAEETARLERSIVAACRLVAADDAITAVHVVMDRRPTYGELLRYRAHADAHNLTMVVLGTGGVVLRRPNRGRIHGPADAGCRAQA